MKQREIILPTINSEQVADEIGNYLVRIAVKVGARGGVLGLSGGVDSTTTAALAKRGFDKYNANPMNKDKLEVVGYLLPSNTNNSEDLEDGLKVSYRLGLRNETQNIEPIVEAHRFTNPEALKNNYDKGNLMSRIRANVLSTKAATERKVVLGTGNKDEDFGIGYYTLFGDGAVHCSPIGNLSKRLVRQMATYLGFKDLANRVPSAGLELGQTDFKDLGYDYDVVELVVEGIEQGFDLEELVEHNQVTELVEKQLPKSRFDNIEQVVRDIFYRHYKVALPKMEIMHPPAAPVTLNYGGGK